MFMECRARTSRALVPVFICAFLAACSTTSSQPERLAVAAPTAEERLNEAKTIIEAESASFFDPSAKARDIAISAVRDVETPIGVRSGVCLRATLTNRMGQEMGARVYLVTFDKGRILQRQTAEPRHGCAGQKFDTALEFKPAVVLQASKEPRKRGSLRSR
jgi:hypothetical protein